MADQTAISFLTRVAKRLGVKLHRSRSRAVGGDGAQRPYQYQVMTPELVAEQIEVVREQLAEDVDRSPDSLVALGRSLAALIDVQSSMVVRGALLRLPSVQRAERLWVGMRRAVYSFY
jgi:DNA-directed RNA polymerase specialized sigma24 family protein